MPLAFQVVEECRDERGVQIGQLQLAGRLSGRLLGEAEQEPEGVAVGRDGVRADPTLRDQALGEERFEDGCQRGHDATASVASSRRAAPAMRRGRSERYQYVEFGSM